MRGEHQIVALREEAPKLFDHRLGVLRARHNRVAVVAQHVGVDGADLRYLHVKGLMRGNNVEPDTADRDLARFDIVRHLMYGAVKGRAEDPRKIIDKRPAAAAVAILVGPLRRVPPHARHKAAARHMVGKQQSRGRQPRTGDIFLQLPVVVKEAGRFDYDGLPLFLDDKDLVREKIIGPVGVKLYAAEIIKIYLTLREGDFFKAVLVHIGFLLLSFVFVPVLFPPACDYKIILLVPYVK